MNTVGTQSLKDRRGKTKTDNLGNEKRENKETQLIENYPKTKSRLFFINKSVTTNLSI